MYIPVSQNERGKSDEEIKLLKCIKACVDLDAEKIQHVISKINYYKNKELGIIREIQCHCIQDGILITLSILCIFSELLMLIEYYSKNRIFFWISLSIVILSQMCHYFLFWNTKMQIHKYEHTLTYTQFILSICTTPISPFFTYFSFLYFDSTTKYISFLFHNGIYANIKSVRAKSGVGFAFQCLFDIFPQNILLLIYILLLSNNNSSISPSSYVSFIVFILFPTYVIYWFLNEINITQNTKILAFNFLIIIIDLFAIYVMIIFIFYFYNFLPFQLWYIFNAVIGIIIPMTYVFIINNADDSCLWWLWSIFCMFTFGFIITISLFIILDILLFTLIYVLNELFFDSIHLLPSFNNQYLWLLVEFICEENCITRLCYINAMLCNIYDTKYYIHNETNSKMELKSYLLNNYHSMFANATLKNMRIECKNTFDKLLSSDGKRYKGVTLKNCSASIPNAFLILKCIKIVLILPIFSFILLIYYHLNDIIIATLIITMVLMLLLVITFITISKQLYFAHHLQIKVAHHLRIRIESFDQKLKCLIYNFNVFNSEKMVKNAFGEGIANIIFGYGIEPLLFDLNNE
eukprot:537093_1